MIDDFKATLSKRGFARPTLFRVEFTDIPGILQNTLGVSEILKDLHFFAESAEFPGIQILTQDVRYYDLTSKFAYGKAHDDLNLTFRLDRDFQVKKFFDVWVNSIYDRKTGNVYYKQTYVGSLQIYQVMENGFSSYAVEFDEVFPIQVGQISLGWDSTGSYSRLPITLAFKRMKTIANKMIFRKPSYKLSSNYLNERTIDEQLVQSKSQLNSMLNDNLGAFRQIKVMNQTDLGDLFGGLEYV